jgi:hypothetical protein
MRSFCLGLGELAQRDGRGAAWASGLAHISEGHYVGDLLGLLDDCAIALDLSLLRLALGDVLQGPPDGADGSGGNAAALWAGIADDLVGEQRRIDPYTGLPYCLGRSEQGRVTVYSTGPDGRDDGGNEVNDIVHPRHWLD